MIEETRSVQKIVELTPEPSIDEELCQNKNQIDQEIKDLLRIQQSA